ncbi:LacI family transcriptional regulator [Alloscardovia theropitheci]|uniref:LacI family transcriptional regulator n=1 Tax=Alloscardovia theropitheci TaxID=2496842 RepID=A0A4R0QUZ6_9BIFI|nr:LacI family DNA-binding transcriptional regulator [Alloscardovia theropitheci]TCD53917.1 LacI family transcriptional regulator [Alloscardovia theropitheci]
MGTTIQDVAESAGVSPSTVSRAFTRPDLVSHKTREKILQVASELHFSLSRSAAALKSGKSLRVALLMSGSMNLWFISSLFEGLNEVLHQEGYDISVFQISSENERKEFFKNLPLRRNADAVVVASFGIEHDEVDQLSSIGIPVIGINADNAHDFGFTGAINIDDIHGSELAARHLLQLGHKNIVYISTYREVTLHFSVQTRINSFLRYCEEHGAKVQHLSCKVSEDGHYQISDVASRILSMDTLPTAIACQEDGLAIPLTFQLERSGIRIPTDISMIGFDDGFYASDLGLTTIRQNPVDLGHKAAHMVLNFINSEPVENPFMIEDAELVIRSSTSRPRIE